MEGSVQRVIVRDLQIHPVTEEPLCLNFLRYHKKTSVRVELPIEFYNQDKSTGLRRGGQMRITMRDLDANTVKGSAPPAIPKSVRLNLANTQLGQKLRAKDIPLPEGMKYNRPNDVAVTIVAKKQRGAVADEEGEAEGARYQYAPIFTPHRFIFSFKNSSNNFTPTFSNKIPPIH